MRRSTLPLLILCAMISLPGSVVLQLVAITQVTVIDMTGAGPFRNLTVVTDGRRITAIGPSATTAVPSGARVIDGQGKFLIPGLWDMHVHTVVPSGRPLLSLFVANGVTGVRDMASDWPTIRSWRREIEAGTLVGPRIVASGPYLEGRTTPIAHIQVRSPADARRAVDSLAGLGVDFVKIHSAVPREAFFTAAREAKRLHLAVAGHLSSNVTVVEASDSGQRSLEHLLGFANRCTKAESVTVAALEPLRRAVFGRCSTQDQRPIYDKIARNDTWVTPTLTAAYEFAILPERALPADTLARYIPDSLRVYLTQIFETPPKLPPEASAQGRRLFARRQETVGALHRAGVAVLAGTDAPMRNSPPGFGLHEELVNLVQSGLSPMAALRAATYEPARYFDALDSLGTIAVGKLADLVLLDADPLADIRNTRRIAAVLTRGLVYDRKELDSLLAAVERAAR